MSRQELYVALMPDPAIHVLREPGNVLAAAPHSYGFESGLFGLRHQVERAIQRAVELGLMNRELLVCCSRDERMGIPEAFGPVLEFSTERRIFRRSVASRQTQDETSPGQLIDRKGLLCNCKRIAQREHDACCADRNVSRRGS